MHDDEADSYSSWFSFRLLGAMAAGLAFGFFALWINYPRLAAAGAAIVFVMGMGLLMTKIVFGFESPKLVWGLAPVVGGAWLLFFWILWLLR